MPIPSLTNLLKITWKEFRDDLGITLGAALAFYALLTIPPLTVFLLFVLKTFLDTPTAVLQILGFAYQFGGQQAALFVRSIITNAATENATSLSIVSIIVFTVGATAFFAHLQGAIATIWNIPQKSISTRYHIRTLLKRRLFALVLILGLGVIILISVLGTVFISLLRTAALPFLPPESTLVLFTIANQLFAALVLFILFTLLYRILPTVKLTYGDIWRGALFTTVLFTLGQIAFTLYVAHTSVNSLYGAIGSLLLLMLWIYYSCIVLLLGAELNQVYARLCGSCKTLFPKHNVRIK